MSLVKKKKSTKRKANALHFLLLSITAMSIAFFVFGIHVAVTTMDMESAPLKHPLLDTQSITELILDEKKEDISVALNGSQPYVAYDTNGKPGYIHDPYYVRNHPLPFTFQADGRNICDEIVGLGQEGPRGQLALRKMTIMNRTESDRAIRVMCMVYSYSKRHDVVRSVAETYGQRCDGFMVASNLTDPSIGAIHIDHPGPEAYQNMWQKVRSMWQYVHDHYLNNFDFFHIGGDDMFVAFDNLKYAVSSYDPDEPMYIGSAMMDSKMKRSPSYYCGGGAGYTLSRETVRRMINEDFNKKRCNPDKTRPDEDRLMGVCLRLKVAKCTHDMDERNETRYHHYDAQFHARWDRRKGDNWNWRKLLKRHNIIAYKERLEGISATSVTFHLISDSPYRDRGIRRYHALLYGLCGEERKLLELTVEESQNNETKE